MRIAHVITRMIVGGAQENTLLNCEDLVRLHGDEVLLITGPALGPEGDLLTQGRGPSFPVAVIPELRRAVHPWRDWISYRKIKRLLADFQPDVVHTHSAKGGILGRMAATSLGVPAVIHTVHGAPFHPYQRAWARKLIQWAEWYGARKCHLMVSVADAMTDLMVAGGVAPREKFVTVYSGMDVAPFVEADRTRDEVRRELGYRPEHVVIGKIARLFHLKGHDDVVDAARQVVRRCDQARFLFVGDGILRESLERRIAEAGLTPYFQFTGLVAPSRIPSLVGTMDALVHASLREGLARALPQALIAGKPVVSYDCDGAREVVLNGQTGFLLAPRDVDGMANALVELVSSPELRAKLGGQGRERFTDQFRHETMTRRLRELYVRLLDQRR
ncbi:MAG TPA: glycosyltransferase family 4 protein [Pirellulaceae bacterium]|nr:glycosyltransferase family 4 protein [Pirellulaceae bacterium]